MVFWSFLGLKGILVIFWVSRVFGIFLVSGVFWSFLEFWRYFGLF